MALTQLLNVFLREALRALLRNKLRSALTTLGITIGVASVVLAIAIGQTGAERVQASLAQLGDNLVWVEAGSRTVSGVRSGTRGTTTLTLDDAEAIAREVPLITRMSPQVDGNIQIIFGNRNWATRYRAGSADYVPIRRWAVASGTNFSREDVDDSAAKVLLGQTVRERLFDDRDPVGETVRIQGQLFTVIGLLAPKGQSAEGRDQDDWVLMPHTTAVKRLRGKSAQWLDDIFCSASSAREVEAAIAQIVALMRQRHHIALGSEDDFNIRRPDEVLKAEAEAADTMLLLLAAIASISLVVGGIGIMNVMLATVAQRTREIGVRMAVGATGSAIRLQFLAEAATLSLLGGVLGIALSFAAADAFARGLTWAISIPPWSLLAAVASSVSAGLVFGFYPAWRASGLDPIEALRHE